MSQAYLINYGSSGMLGRFLPSAEDQAYARGERVVVRSERGRELGTVLATADELALPASLKHIPGELLSRAVADDEQAIVDLMRQADSVYPVARKVVAELNLPVEIVDVEAVDDPLTYVVHLLRFGEIALQPLQDTLEQRCRAAVLIHDVTNLEALEEQAESGCGSCGSGGSGGCGSGGCSTGGSCGSGCGTEKEFGQQWKDYFAELRGKMEERKRQCAAD